MGPIPKRLRNEPLVEVIWQAQFDAPNAGDLLPGVLFEALRKQYSGLRMQRLPAADFPALLTQANPQLRYFAKIRLDAPGEPFIWQAGDHVVTLNCRKPYVGWSLFKAAVEHFTNVVDASNLVPKLERHSLRYLDLLTLDPAPDLAALNLSLRMGDHQINRHNLSLRVEIPDGDCTHVVQVATPAKSNLPEGEVTGTLVDVETIANNHQTTWDEVRAQLDDLHWKSKQLFFEHILSGAARDRLAPEY